MVTYLDRVCKGSVGSAAGAAKRIPARVGHSGPEAGVCQRATYIVDRDNTIRFVMVTDLSVGRSVEEVLRVLDACRSTNCARVTGRRARRP